MGAWGELKITTVLESATTQLRVLLPSLGRPLGSDSVETPC